MLSAVGGFFLPFQGLRLVFSSGLRRYVVAPLLINLFIFAALAYFGALFFDQFMDRWLPSQEWLAFLRWLLWLLFAVTYALGLFYGFTLLANLIASPFNAVLAAKVEEKLTGKRPGNADASFWASIAPAIGGEIGKILYFLSRAVPLLILLLIPGVNVVASLLWMLFGFWFLTVEYADYPMGNHAIKASAQRGHLRRSRWKSLFFGAGVTTMMLIPILQFAAMPAAVAGATRFWVDDLASRLP